MGRKPCCNPYSTVGLDKFDSLSAELSAKREHVARKTGIPEAMVRFAHTNKGWVPLVLQNVHGGTGNDGGHSSLAPTENTKKEEGEPNEEHGIKGDENGVYGFSSMQGPPSWLGFLKTIAIGVLTVSLKSLLLFGVMCMKNFIDSGIFYFSEMLKAGELIKPMFCVEFEEHETSREQGGTLLYSNMRQDLNTQEKQMKRNGNNNNEKFGRSVSREGKARKSIQGLQESGRAANGESDVTVGATLMIILLFFLVVYGRLCAICLTSALLYVVPKLRIDGNNDTCGNDHDNMDLRSKEYRKKVIMDGLLARNHGKL